MKYKSLLLCSLFFIAVFANGQRFHELPLNDISGKPLALSNYADKKILIFLIPLTQDDSAVQQLLTFQQRYGDKVHIFGIPSIEDGYQLSAAASLQLLYQPLGITLTEGMYTKKSSPDQSPLLGWLTDKDKNQHFDMDSKGTGSKFFVSKSGELYGVLTPDASLLSSFVDEIVHSPIQ